MTTTINITTDDAIIISDAIAAYRLSRDRYKKATADLQHVAQRVAAGNPFYDYEAAANAHRDACDDLHMQRLAIVCELGIDWAMIDNHDGFAS